MIGGGNKKKNKMETAKFQIRTNSKNFGDTMGVYDFNAPVYEYGRDDNGQKVKKEVGKGKFVKQESFDHGTFEMNRQEARDFTKKLNDNCRNGVWVRLYEMG